MDMEDDGLAAHVCSLIEAGARECESLSSEDGAPCSSASGRSLSEGLLSELYKMFAEAHSGGERCKLDSGLWNELAERRVSLAAFVGGMSRSMEKGGTGGLKAAAIYLGLMLVEDCPLYSLFNPLTFHVMTQCIRGCCNPSRAVQEGKVRQGKVKGKGRKGKRGRGPESSRESAGCEMEVDEVSPSQEQASQGYEQEQSQGRKELACVQDVVLFLGALQNVLHCLHLKEHPDTLKIVVELVVDLPLLTADLEEECEESGASRGGGKVRRMAKAGSMSVLIMSFSVLRGLLDASHGDVMDTAVMVLRALTPSILCTQAAGTAYQKGKIRAAALEFVSADLASNRDVREAVVAVTRYLCLKAPEKVEARSLAVEAVVMIVKGLGPSEWGRLGKFVAKLSRGKPRHRLLAVDVAVALFEKLPDPFERDVEAYVTSPRIGSTSQSAALKGESQHLASPDRGEDGEAIDSTVNHSWGVSCVEAVLHRCSDKVPTIRARALGNLGQVVDLLSGKIRCRGHLQTLLGFVNPPAAHTGCSAQTDGAVNKCETPMLIDHTPDVDECGPSATPLTPGAGHGDLGSLLRRRCLDEKAGVRKAALSLMKKTAALSGKPPDESTLQAMGAACADPLVSIRKAALSALTEVLRKFPGDQKVILEWLQSALPLALDNETSIQDECLDIFQEIVLDRIATVSAIKLSSLNVRLQRSRGKRKGQGPSIDEQHQDFQDVLPPGILDTLKGMADGGAIASCVKQICTGLGKRNRVRPGVALALQNIINASCSKPSRRRRYDAAPEGAWMLLAEVSAFVPKAVGWDFLRTHWQLLEKQDRSKRTPGVQEAVSTPYSCSKPQTPGLDEEQNGNSFVSAAWAADRVHLLQTISNIALELPSEAIYDLASELLSHLEAFNMHPAEVAAHVKALATLCRRKADIQEQGDELVSVWVKTILRKAGDILQAYISKSSLQDEQNRVHGDTLTTPKPRSSRKTKSRVPSLPKGSAKSTRNEKHLVSPTEDCLPVPTSQLVTVVFTIGAAVLVCPSEKPGHLVTLLQALVAPQKVTPVLGPQQADEDGSSFVIGVAPEVTVQVWITLGKLCLADNSLAKRCIPLFIQELDRSKSAAIRNNIMIAMTDFCVRYTALVDGYIHKLTKSLQDPCELVRRQTFVLLARLLQLSMVRSDPLDWQRDYVKWRGMIFHRFLLALVDDSTRICQLANFLMGTILKVKAPLLAYNSFVETIFLLNDCQGHSGYSSALRSSESERRLFSLRGNSDSMVTKRMHIYNSLLHQMAPEHLLATSAKLYSEILAAAVDGLLDISDPCAQCVLEDALKVLASKEMHITNKGHAAANDGLDAEEENGHAAAVAAVKGRVVTQLMKKNLVQNAIPIFIELKRMLESRNSPLVGMLMECLRVLLKDYKNEIEEILVADKQLQKEIMYDIQKYEAAKARGKVAVAAAEISRTAAAQGQATPSGTQMLRTTEHGGPEERASPSGTAALTPVSARSPGAGETTPSLAGMKDRDKENVGASNRTVQGQCPRVLRSSTAKKRVASAGPAAPSPRVTWLDQTPGYSRPEYPSTRPESSGLVDRTPNPRMGRPPVTPSPCIRAPGIPSASRPPTQAVHLVGAVADVAAAATAAAVLKEVNGNSSTPLKSMSIPRMKLAAPVTGQDEVAHTPSTGEQENLTSVEDRDTLEAGQSRGSPSFVARSQTQTVGSRRRTRSHSNG